MSDTTFDLASHTTTTPPVVKSRKPLTLANAPVGTNFGATTTKPITPSILVSPKVK